MKSFLNWCKLNDCIHNQGVLTFLVNVYNINLITTNRKFIANFGGLHLPAERITSPAPAHRYKRSINVENTKRYFTNSMLYCFCSTARTFFSLF